MQKYISKWLSFCIIPLLTVEQKTLFRKLECLKLKIVEREEHIKFNTQCIQQVLFPNFTNVHVDYATTGTQRFVTTFRKERILYETRRLEEELVGIKRTSEETSAQLRNIILSNVKMQVIAILSERIIYSEKIILAMRHSKKLCNLYKSNIPI